MASQNIAPAVAQANLQRLGSHAGLNEYYSCAHFTFHPLVPSNGVDGNVNCLSFVKLTFRAQVRVPCA